MSLKISTTTNLINHYKRFLLQIGVLQRISQKKDIKQEQRSCGKYLPTCCRYPAGDLQRISPEKYEMLGELREMFITMKEYVKYYRCVFAFQVLLAHLDK
jgi:hypothetical protein